MSYIVIILATVNKVIILALDDYCTIAAISY